MGLNEHVLDGISARVMSFSESEKSESLEVLRKSFNFSYLLDICNDDWFTCTDGNSLDILVKETLLEEDGRFVLFFNMTLVGIGISDTRTRSMPLLKDSSTRAPANCFTDWIFSIDAGVRRRFGEEGAFGLVFIVL